MPIFLVLALFNDADFDYIASGRWLAQKELRILTPGQRCTQGKQGQGRDEVVLSCEVWVRLALLASGYACLACKCLSCLKR